MQDLAGTYGDRCHADVIQSGRNSGVAVWDFAGKHARKKAEGEISCMCLVPKGQSKDAGVMPTYKEAAEILVHC